MKKIVLAAIVVFAFCTLVSGADYARIRQGHGRYGTVLYTYIFRENALRRGDGFYGTVLYTLTDENDQRCIRRGSGSYGTVIATIENGDEVPKAMLTFIAAILLCN